MKSKRSLSRFKLNFLNLKVQIMQQHNNYKLTRYLKSKRTNCQEQNIGISLQKKITKRISETISIT